MEHTETQTAIIPPFDSNKAPGEYRDENSLLRDRIAEQEYLKEVLVEKKAQIVFLQNQLEQRIKTGHQSEQQKEQLDTENQRLARQLNLLEEELTVSREQIESTKNNLREKEEKLLEMQQATDSNAGQVIWLENSLKELRQQNELLNASVGDNNDTIASLTASLEQEKHRTSIAEQKLVANKELLSRLYKDFTAFISEEEIGAPPVIALNPDYSKTSKAGWGESVVES